MGYWQRAWSQASTSVVMAWVIGREHGVRLPVSHYGMGYWQRAWSQAPSLVVMAWVIGGEHCVGLAFQSLWHGLLAESMELG